MAFDEPTGSNIQYTVPIEHNTSTVPGIVVVDVDGAAVAGSSGTMVVDADGVIVANEDATPIGIVDYRQPLTFVSRGLA